MSLPPLEPTPPDGLSPYPSPDPLPETWQPELVAAPRETPDLMDLLVLLGVFIGAGVAIFAIGAVGMGVWMHMHKQAVDSMTMSQKLAVGIPLQIGWYLFAAAIGIPIFRSRWQKTFSEGVHWNGVSAAARFWLLVPAGVLLSIAVALASTKIKMPHDAPVLGLFKNAALAWLATAYGVLVAPAVEETVFRGFLLPSLGRHTGNIIAAAITSAIFALMHAEQTGFAWAAVALLFCVSLVLCFVRLRFNSVAASTVVHVCYNSVLFISLIHATGGYRHFDMLPH